MWNKKPDRSVNFKKIRNISSASPSPDIIHEAAVVIQKGGVVTYPTGGLYGLGADALNASAIKRVYAIKQRPADKPLLILIGRRSEVAEWAHPISMAAERIMARFWPGGVTLVFEAKSALPAELTAGTGKIGIRLPGHPVAAALVRRVGRPVTGTSANISGRKGPSESPHADPAIADHVDLMLDAGKLQGGAGSTVVDVTVDPPMVLRQGIVSAADIFAAVN